MENSTNEAYFFCLKEENESDTSEVECEVSVKEESLNEKDLKYEDDFSHNEPCIMSREEGTIDDEEICQFKSIYNVEKGIRFKLFECFKCSYITTRKCELDRHISQNHSKFLFNCAQCDYKTNTKSNLVKHINSIHLKLEPLDFLECDYNSSQNVCSTTANTAMTVTHPTVPSSSDNIQEIEQKTIKNTKVKKSRASYTNEERYIMYQCGTYRAAKQKFPNLARTTYYDQKTRRGKILNQEYEKKRQVEQIPVIEVASTSLETGHQTCVTINKLIETKDSIKKRNQNRRFRALETILWNWIFNAMKNNISLSRTAIKEASFVFAEKMGQSNFKGSNNWVDQFMQRNKLTDAQLHGEIFDAGVNDVEPLKNQLVCYIQEHDLELFQIYNADEAALFYKALPNRNVPKDEPSNKHGKKLVKTRVSVLCAANADGSSQVRPTIIGRFIKPRCFEGRTTFPFKYYNQEKAWFTKDILNAWFYDEFVPHVKQEQMARGIPEENVKALLLMDSTGAFPKGTILKSGGIKVMFLPMNTTSLIQPMDQGVIASIKCIYRKNQIRACLVTKLTSEDIYCEYTPEQRTAQNYKEYSLYDGCINWTESWYDLDRKTLKNAWKNILPESLSSDMLPNESNEQIIEQASNEMRAEIPDDKHNKYDKNDIMYAFEADLYVPTRITPPNTGTMRSIFNAYKHSEGKELYALYNQDLEQDFSNEDEYEEYIAPESAKFSKDTLETMINHLISYADHFSNRLSKESTLLRNIKMAIMLTYDTLHDSSFEIQPSINKVLLTDEIIDNISPNTTILKQSPNKKCKQSLMAEYLPKPNNGKDRGAIPVIYAQNTGEEKSLENLNTENTCNYDSGYKEINVDVLPETVYSRGSSPSQSLKLPGESYTRLELLTQSTIAEVDILDSMPIEKAAPLNITYKPTTPKTDAPVHQPSSINVLSHPFVELHNNQQCKDLNTNNTTLHQGLNDSPEAMQIKSPFYSKVDEQSCEDKMATVLKEYVTKYDAKFHSMEKRLFMMTKLLKAKTHVPTKQKCKKTLARKVRSEENLQKPELNVIVPKQRKLTVSLQDYRKRIKKSESDHNDDPESERLQYKKRLRMSNVP